MLSIEPTVEPTVAVVTLGCRVNQVDSEWLYQCARQQGYRQAVDGDVLDLVVINTCSVTAESDRQARQEIHRAVRNHPQARVVVTGCYAERHRQALADIPGVTMVFGNQDKQKFPQLLHDLRPQHDLVVPLSPLLPWDWASTLHERARAWLQVQNGCDERCTFCLIPQLRGPSRSEPPQSVLAQARRLLQSGYHELVLTGINLGSYGRDLVPTMTLTDLIRDLLVDWPRHARLRLSSIDPTDIDEPFIRLLATEQRVCPHLHLSVQSGDDLILKRMHRRYHRQQLLTIVAQLRQARPDLLLGADLIVGFPGETSAAFDNSCALVEQAEIALPHLFRYSDRPGTAAASFPQRSRVTADVMRQRSGQLRAMGQQVCTTVANRYIGRIARVLMESITTDSQGGVDFRGRSEWFLPVEGHTTTDRLSHQEIGAVREALLCSWDAEKVLFIGKILEYGLS
ncbi:MAG: tRNA (N(6)-L-threonylcarbamoyladenosine(37)-C(2))-methylthiotransferase MtaB [Magnetococcales bacterium]|nr:tRNA (N(6)-L-threonylcarbamoyladenosine(37)-C(2))-methylthiotransferase MtaB [Magnetococcales bacterium]